MTCPILAPYIAAMTIQPIFCVAALSFCGAAWDFDRILARFKVDSGHTPTVEIVHPYSGNMERSEAPPQWKLFRDFVVDPPMEIQYQR